MDSPLPRKPILCIDFDGVIHSYDEGWKDGKIYGSVVEGFFEWADSASDLFQLAVYSSRSKEPGMVDKMQAWLFKEWQRTEPRAPYPALTFVHEKPPAFLTIDDRAVQFKGTWKDEHLDPQLLLKFQPVKAKRA